MEGMRQCTRSARASMIDAGSVLNVGSFVDRLVLRVGSQVWFFRHSEFFFSSVIDSGLVGTTGRGAARAEYAHGTPTQSHISPSILVYEDTWTYRKIASIDGHAGFSCQKMDRYE